MLQKVKASTERTTQLTAKEIVLGEHGKKERKKQTSTLEFPHIGKENMVHSLLLR